MFFHHQSSVSTVALRKRVASAGCAHYTCYHSSVFGLGLRWRDDCTAYVVVEVILESDDSFSAESRKNDRAIDAQYCCGDAALEVCLIVSCLASNSRTLLKQLVQLQLFLAAALLSKVLIAGG